LKLRTLFLKVTDESLKYEPPSHVLIRTFGQFAKILPADKIPDK
jgi:hypothetical protein